MRLYRVRREVTHYLVATVAAPDEDAAYSLALDTPDAIWELSTDPPHIERKPCDVEDVTPWGLEPPLPQ